MVIIRFICVGWSNLKFIYCFKSFSDKHWLASSHFLSHRCHPHWLRFHWRVVSHSNDAHDLHQSLVASVVFTEQVLGISWLRVSCSVKVVSTTMMMKAFIRCSVVFRYPSAEGWQTFNYIISFHHVLSWAISTIKYSLLVCYSLETWAVNRQPTNRISDDV